MCNSKFNPHLAPLDESRVQQLQTIFPNEQKFIKDVAKQMMTGLSPQILKHQFRKRSQGILSKYNLLYVPLSIVAKTAKETWTRFRPQSVKELHTSFLSFMMAETNRNGANTIMCDRYGLAFGQGHCCGVLFGKPADIKKYQQSQLYADRNFLRSHLEALAMPVEEVPFELVPFENIDLGIAEREFYELYYSTLNAMDLPAEPIADPGLMKIWHAVLSAVPESQLELVA
jgi:hypothetical protein